MNPTTTTATLTRVQQRPSSRTLLQAADVDTFDASIPQTSAAAVRRPLGQTQTAPFDSSMALTIIVLLTALFFLGFFSVFIRRFAAAAAEEEADPTPPSRARPSSNRKGGLDEKAVGSLPLVAYEKVNFMLHQMVSTRRTIDDCPICLIEFQEGESVKLIPYCGHVFHPGCVDTWLSSHVTCPLCRSAQLFKSVEEVRLDVSTVGIGNTWRESARSGGVRRVCSCSNLVNPTVLRRSSSF